jgi:ATP-binding cassette subfamily B protein
LLPAQIQSQGDEAEDKIFGSIAEICRDKTAIVISHRLSAVSLCDKIALLENGRMLEYGKFDELISANGRFAEIYHKQSSGYTFNNIFGKQGAI